MSERGSHSTIGDHVDPIAAQGLHADALPIRCQMGATDPGTVGGVRDRLGRYGVPIKHDTVSGCLRGRPA
jgi:hypothetical protein